MKMKKTNNIPRDYNVEFSAWSFEVNGRTITVWDDGDIVFGLNKDDENNGDIMFSHSTLKEITNAADDYFDARYKYRIFK